MFIFAKNYNINDMKKIMVIGGSGFVGKQICRIASLENESIISLSRSGMPSELSDNEFKHVKWLKADIFHPENWKKHLQDCSAVIHCIGILEEEPNKGITYERMIFDTAKIAATISQASGIERFVYISAGAGAPDTPLAYMKNKLAAEKLLKSNQFNFDVAVLKPGMIYGSERPETIEEYKVLKNILDNPLLRDELYPNRPLPVEAVALFALRAAQGNIEAGIYGVDGIENYYLKSNKQQ